MNIVKGIDRIAVILAIIATIPGFMIGWSYLEKSYQIKPSDVQWNKPFINPNDVIWDQEEPKKEISKTAASVIRQSRSGATTINITADKGDGNEEYWASVLREKAGLEIEIEKMKNEISANTVDVVEVTRENNELKVQMDIFWCYPQVLMPHYQFLRLKMLD